MSVLGQQSLIDKFDKQIQDDNLARFIILEGPKGQEKQQLAEYIAYHTNSIKVITDDVSVENIRNIINNAYKVTERTTFIILNIDRMSLASKNALLKVTEEPPNKARFVLTIENIGNTLDTIKSRGTVYQLCPYTLQNIEDYYMDKYNGTLQDAEKIYHIVHTPYEVDLIVKYGLYDFIGYVNKVIDNIAKVSGSNAFKIADKIAFKDEEDKYDMRLFLQCVVNECVDRTDDLYTKSQYVGVVVETFDILKQLGINGINKSMLFDSWILNVRKVLMEQEN